MNNIIGNMIKGNINMDDKLIAMTMLSSAKTSADLYLNSTLTSTTPELRALYAASLTQMVEGHTALTELCVNKEWLKPYTTPSGQLACSYNETY